MCSRKRIKSDSSGKRKTLFQEEEGGALFVLTKGEKRERQVGGGDGDSGGE